MASMELQPRDGTGILPLSLRRQPCLFPLSRSRVGSKEMKAMCVKTC